MSILTGDLSAREGVLCVDSLARDGGFGAGEPTHVSKAFVVPHLGMVFGTRGAAALPAWLLVTLNNRRLRNFEEVREQFGVICDDAQRGALGVMDGYGQFRGGEALAMGWSHAERRVVGVYAKNIDTEIINPATAADVEVADFYTVTAMPDGSFAIPGIPAEEIGRIMSRHRKMGPDRMVAFAKAQRDFTDRTAGAGSIGGRLYSFSVTRAATECRMLYEWPQEKATDDVRAVAA